MSARLTADKDGDDKEGHPVEEPACDNCGEKLLVELTTLEPLSPSCEICRNGLLLIALEVTDALLTYIGIRKYGLQAEGNSFIREMMSHFGTANVLALLKLTAIIAIVVLVRRLKLNSRAARGLFLVTCFYVIAALLPWTYYLFVLPLVRG